MAASPNPPNLQNPIIQQCFIPLGPTHARLLQDLQNTIFLSPILDHELPPRNHLRTLLMARYGGLPSNWPFTEYKEGLLFKSPSWLLPNEPIRDSDFWEVTYGITMLPWQFITSLPHRLQPTRRTIVIKDFPIDLWHWAYFSQATSAMGLLVKVAPECLDGRTKSFVRLMIDCYDPSHVPDLLYIVHSGTRTRCVVLMEGRTSLLGDQLWPPPPDDDDDGEDGNDQINEQPNELEEGDFHLGNARGFPQFIHLRATILSYPNPARSGAPATARRQIQKRSTAKGYEPGPGLGKENEPGLGREKEDKAQKFTACAQNQPHRPPACQMDCRIILTQSNKCEDRNSLVWPNLCAPQPLPQPKITQKIKRRLPQRILYLIGKSHAINRASYNLKTHTVPPACLARKEKRNILSIHVAPTTKQKPNPSPKTKNTKNKINTPHLNSLKLSVLGPHPSTVAIKGNTHLFPFPITPQIQNQLKIPLSANPNSLQRKMEASDEELIRKFAGLQTEGETSQTSIIIPISAATTKNWECCAMVRVCTDRPVFFEQFERQMRRLWGVRPTTIFKQIDKGIFQIELTEISEYHKILDEGPWFYRQDLVATKPCNSPKEAMNPEILMGEIWVQFHNIPLDSLNEEGISILTAPVGNPVSEPVPGHIAGKHFFKIKMAIKLNEALKDTVKIRHPTLGEMLAYVVYERLGRACVFCAKLGHEVGSCADRTRLARIRNRPENQGRKELQNILKPTIGPWILNSMLIPTSEQRTARAQTSSAGVRKNVGLKRPLQETTEGQKNHNCSGFQPVITYRIEDEEEEMSEGDSSEGITKKAKAARQTSPPTSQ